MRNIVFGFFSVIALPILVVLGIAAISGVLTKGIETATGGDAVNGFTLAELQEFELTAVGGRDTQFYPGATVVRSYTIDSSIVSFGGDIEAVSGHLAVAPAEYRDVVDYYTGHPRCRRMASDPTRPRR